VFSRYVLFAAGGVILLSAIGFLIVREIEKRDVEEGSVANEPNGVAPQTVGRLRRWWRPVLAVVGILIAAFFFLLSRQVLSIVQKPSWPPAANAITAAGAQQAAEAFAARSDPRPSD
jgi:hypothetical protein